MPTSNGYASGEFVAQHLDKRPHGDLEAERIQPNGVDIGIHELYRTSGQADFYADGEYDKPDRMKLTTTRDPGSGRKTAFYDLPRGSYIIVYDVEFTIPEGYVGRVYPRSRLMRSGLHLDSALWDQGHEGAGEGLLHVPTGINRVTLPITQTIGQFSLITADEVEDDDHYDGMHQGERLKAGPTTGVTVTGN
jgi:dUTP pyrophosphatase